MGAARLVSQGNLSSTTLDRAVGNILTKKFASRLFDSPKIDPAMSKNINSPEHRALAREAAAQGTVLLRNEGGLLPIDITTIRNVAVVGPFGDGADAVTAQLGGYTPGRIGPPPLLMETDVVTVARAIRARSLNVTFTQGSGGGRGGPGTPKGGIPAAVTAAEAADLTVAVIGTMACGCCNRCGNGELGDRASLDPEGEQLALIEALVNSSARSTLVVVLIHGRPVTFGQGNSLVESIPALFAAWRPGEEGGNAIADLLFGDANPSAKLAQAWPRSAGHINTPSSPWYQTHSSMTGSFYYGYGDGTPISALFQYGFGLSYTTFVAGAPVAGALSSAPVNGTTLENVVISVKVNVTNTGKLAGATPVIVTYAKQTRRVVRYLRMTCGFEKVALAPGETKEVSVEVRLSDFARYDESIEWHDLLGNKVQGAYVVDGGTYFLHTGTCVSVGAVWDDTKTCHSQFTTIEVPGNLWVYV